MFFIKFSLSFRSGCQKVRTSSNRSLLESTGDAWIVQKVTPRFHHLLPSMSGAMLYLGSKHIKASLVADLKRRGKVFGGSYFEFLQLKSND